MMRMISMINKNFAIILLALGLFLLMDSVVGQMQVFNTPLLQAQPLQSGSSASDSNMVYPTTPLLEAQPLLNGPESTNAGWKVLSAIDRYDVVQFSHAIGDELAAINCYSNGKQIASLYFMSIDPLPGNFVTSEENKIAVLYYQYNRYNDILNMLKTGKEIYLVYYDQNYARIESRNIDT
jgi:hypothetical protein